MVVLTGFGKLNPVGAILVTAPKSLLLCVWRTRVVVFSLNTITGSLAWSQA